MRSRNQSLLACLVAVALAVPALAQSGSVTQYPTCPDPPPKLSQVELDAARASWRVANEAYAKGDYQKALTNLKDAFGRDCSRSELLTQIALIYELLGNRAEALHALETYLQRNPKAADAETVRDKIQKLRAMVQSTATATTTQPTATATVTATVTATATAPTATATATEAPESHGHTAGPWIVVGVGVAAAIAGGVMLGVGQSDVSKSRDGCTVSSKDGSLDCPSPKTSDGQDRQTLNSTGTTLSNVGVIVGAVGLAAIVGGLIWHFAEPTGAKTTAFMPVFAPGYGGVSLSGHF